MVCHDPAPLGLLVREHSTLIGCLEIQPQRSTSKLNRRFIKHEWNVDMLRGSQDVGSIQPPGFYDLGLQARVSPRANTPGQSFCGLAILTPSSDLELMCSFCCRALCRFSFEICVAPATERCHIEFSIGSNALLSGLHLSYIFV